MNAIPSISSNSIWSTTGSEYSSGISSDLSSKITFLISSKIKYYFLVFFIWNRVWNVIFLLSLFCTFLVLYVIHRFVVFFVDLKKLKKKIKISEPKIDRDSSSPTNSMRSTSPDLKVFWPQQTKNKTELYHQLQLQQQLKLKQQHLLTPGMMNTIQVINALNRQILTGSFLRDLG